MKTERERIAEALERVLSDADQWVRLTNFGGARTQHDEDAALLRRAEPVGEPVDLRFGDSEGLPTDTEPFRERQHLLHWVIAGGESGPGARPCDVAWIRTLVEQCREAGVACFVKQLGAIAEGTRAPLLLSDPKGGDPEEWPEDLRVREYPRA